MTSFEQWHDNQARLQREWEAEQARQQREWREQDVHRQRIDFWWGQIALLVSCAILAAAIAFAVASR